MNAKLQAIINQAAENLKALAKDDEEKILAAWHSCEEEATANESKPVFKLGVTITLDLDADSMEVALGYSVKRKTVWNGPIPDPDQPELLEELPADKSVKAAVNNFIKTVKAHGAEIVVNPRIHSADEKPE